MKTCYLWDEGAKCTGEVFKDGLCKAHHEALVTDTTTPPMPPVEAVKWTSEIKKKFGAIKKSEVKNGAYYYGGAVTEPHVHVYGGGSDAHVKVGNKKYKFLETKRSKTSFNLDGWNYGVSAVKGDLDKEKRLKLLCAMACTVAKRADLFENTAALANLLKGLDD